MISEFGELVKAIRSCIWLLIFQNCSVNCALFSPIGIRRGNPRRNKCRREEWGGGFVSCARLHALSIVASDKRPLPLRDCHALTSRVDRQTVCLSVWLAKFIC